MSRTIRILLLSGCAFIAAIDTPAALRSALAGRAGPYRNRALASALAGVAFPSRDPRGPGTSGTPGASGASATAGATGNAPKPGALASRVALGLARASSEMLLIGPGRWPGLAARGSDVARAR